MRKEISNIEGKAEKVLKKLGITDAPVQLDRILSHYQITLLKAPSATYSGMMLTTDNKTYIGLNSSENDQRKRFTIAHELGHYFLENAEERAFIDDAETIENGIKLQIAFRGKKHKKGDYEEMRANAFAASILMPAKWLIKDLRKVGKEQMLSEKTIKLLSKKYEVSEMAMQYRIMNVLNDRLFEAA